VHLTHAGALDDLTNVVLADATAADRPTVGIAPRSLLDTQSARDRASARCIQPSNVDPRKRNGEVAAKSPSTGNRAS
jgi:hypothetical protein